jgi:colicin import membrane protein
MSRMNQSLNTLMSKSCALIARCIAVRLCAASAMVVLALLWPMQGTAADILSAADPAGGVVGRYPVGSIKSSKMADAALADVSKERSAIEARFVAEDQACHPQFFATSCMDQAKEHRRHALRQLHRIENEAHVFKRQARVAERDQALEGKGAPARADTQEGAKRQQAHESLGSRKAADGTSEEQASEAKRKVQTTIFSDRDARHEAKLKRLEVEEAGNAKKRAENVAAYEKKAQEAQARQKEVAAKKAEKDQKRRRQQSLLSDSK